MGCLRGCGGGYESILALRLLQQLLHVNPQLAPRFPLGFGECGERLLVALAGKVGVGLPVHERLHCGGSVVRLTLFGYLRRGSVLDGEQLLLNAGSGVLHSKAHDYRSVRPSHNLTPSSSTEAKAVPSGVNTTEVGRALIVARS